VLRERGISDPATVRALRASVARSAHGGHEGGGEGEGGRLAYVPGGRGAGGAPAVTMVAPTIPATSRLLRPTAAMLAATGRSGGVTAADVAAVHMRGTLGR
jgi:hypothetical protein